MTAIHDPRLLALAAVAGGGIAVGGVPGFLIVFTASLVAVDRLLDVRGSTFTGAERAFARLTRARRRRRVGELEYLADDTGWAATAPRRHLGTQTIAIDSIGGTTDRHKAEAFDRDFRPPRWSRGRWTQMYLAAQRGVSLPPVSVYRVGDRHYLRDGHHRVSVSRAIGVNGIEARVVELRR
jgi:hypothetical protein